MLKIIRTFFKVDQRTPLAFGIAKNTIFQLIGKLATMGVTVLITYLITHNYGEGTYGDFSLMQNIPALFFVIVDFGLNAISVREAAKHEEKLYHYFVNILVFRFLFSAVIILALLLALEFLPYSEELKRGIRISLPLILTFSFFSTANIIFQTKLRYDLSAKSQIAGYIFILLASMILIKRGAPVSFLSFSYVIGGFLTFGLAFLFISKLGLKKEFYLDKPLLKSLFKESLPLGVMFIFSQISFKEDTVILSLLRIPSWVNMNHSQVVGVYSLPYKIFEVTLVLPTFFMNSVYPILVRFLNQDLSLFLKGFKKSLLFLAISGFLVSLLGIVLSPFLVNFFGGERFSYSVPILRILLGGEILFYLTQPLSWFLVSLKGQKYLPLIYFTSAIFNLITNLIFIPKYSFYAAAGITVASEFLVLIMLVFFARKTWKNQLFLYSKV